MIYISVYYLFIQKSLLKDNKINISVLFAVLDVNVSTASHEEMGIKAPDGQFVVSEFKAAPESGLHVQTAD